MNTNSKFNLISDKCKTDFEKWLNKQEDELYKTNFHNAPKLIQISYLVEWFDIIGLNIYTKPRFHYGGLSFDGYVDGMEISKIETGFFKTRTDAFLSAIELANENYNSSKV